MELWIRSQNKLILTKLEYLMLELEATKNYSLWKIKTKINEIDYSLSFYKSKKRALEVLDEIHQRLIDLQMLEMLQNASFTTRSIECVYQMPNE